MKKLTSIILLLAVISIGCNQSEKEEHRISKRDYSITKKNAYNDLFLDSMEVVNFIEKNKIPDTLANRITSFYNARNYEYAWFSSDGLSEQGMGFSSLLNFSGDTSAKENKMEQTIDYFKGADNVKVTTKNKTALKTELQLTENLIKYSYGKFANGYVKRRQLEKFIPAKKEGVMRLADSIIKISNGKDGYSINEGYDKLINQLKKYVTLEHSGGWPAVSISHSGKFKKGHHYPEIGKLKKRLIMTEDLPALDSSDIYNENLENGIKRLQQRFGLTPDGKINNSLLTIINVPVKERIEQIIINMNRMIWLPQKPEGTFIEVNIPAFMMRVTENGKTAFTMPVVVGKDAHSTTTFSDFMTTIVFSPYWNVPPGIAKNEIIPAMDSDKNYLEKHNMEITGESNGVPVIRQKPGADNSLGKVKFLFPNSFNIYLHDTPAKDLFKKDIRAYSHGCIRLENAEKLANFLLRNDSKWNAQKIHEAMNRDTPEVVKLKQRIPVFISYYTAWVDDNGKLNFREDIYGHDKEVAAKMFTSK